MKFFNKSLIRFAKMHRRERLLLVAAVSIGLYLVLSVAAFGPQRIKVKELQTQISGHQAELATLNKALADIEQAALEKQRLRAAHQAELDTLKKQIADAEEILGRTGGKGAQSVVAELKKMLAPTSGVALTSLRILPTQPFALPAGILSGDAAKAAGSMSLYRHGVEISLKGDYMALLDYMSKLEQSSGYLFWSDASLDASYPNATLKMVVYTLNDQAISPVR